MMVDLNRTMKTSPQTWKKKTLSSLLCFIIGAASSSDLHVNGFLVGVECCIKFPPQSGGREVFIMPADNLNPDEI